METAFEETLMLFLYGYEYWNILLYIGNLQIHTHISFNSQLEYIVK